MNHTESNDANGVKKRGSSYKCLTIRGGDDVIVRRLLFSHGYIVNDDGSLSVVAEDDVNERSLINAIANRIEASKPMPTEDSKMFDDHFWDLV